ncbi:MAG TPA: phosphonate C-P lyase system protein PhnG [Aggregatilineales bacterium]|nr:phosphonate C-P lyase system protein PhnG [Aggregatilineales bacterium]
MTQDSQGVRSDSPMIMDALDHSECLSILAAAPPEAVIAHAEALIPRLGEPDIISNRTVLTTLPHIGEVLVTEVCLLLADGTEGYSAILGTDSAHAVAVAILDAALIAHPDDGIGTDILAFINTQADALAHAERELEPA